MLRYVARRLLATVIPLVRDLAVGVGDDVGVTLAVCLVAAVGTAAVVVVAGVAVRLVNGFHLVTLVVGFAHDGLPLFVCRASTIQAGLPGSVMYPIT